MNTTSHNGTDPAGEIGVLELIASQRPDLLGGFIEIVMQSSSQWVFFQLAQVWDIEPEELGVAAIKAARDLDRLYRYRGTRHTDKLVSEPNLPAIICFAEQRRLRVTARSYRLKMERIMRRLHREHERAKRRQWIENFMAGGSEAESRVDVRAFLGIR